MPGTSPGMTNIGAGTSSRRHRRDDHAFVGSQGEIVNRSLTIKRRRGENVRLRELGRHADDLLLIAEVEADEDGLAVPFALVDDGIALYVHEPKRADAQGRMP